jgi:hypothetical protein
MSQNQPRKRMGSGVTKNPAAVLLVHSPRNRSQGPHCARSISAFCSLYPPTDYVSAANIPLHAFVVSRTT